jgi:hypothetical protein
MVDKTNSLQKPAIYATLNINKKFSISPTHFPEKAERTSQSAKASKTHCCFKSKHHRTKNLLSDIADVTTGAQSRHHFIIMVPATTQTY